MNDDTKPAPAFDREQFREIVRHPAAHAIVLQQYRLGEYAGVVALRRLLEEMRPEGNLHEAMTIHFRDEERHSWLFTEWMRRLGVEPPPFPADVEGFFSTDRAEYESRRALLAQLPAEQRRIVVFAAINAIERTALQQFDAHLDVLDVADDRAALASVVAEEKFHVRYVEHELDRQMQGEHATFATMAVDEARARFAAFTEMRRREGRAAVERLLGAARA